MRTAAKRAVRTADPAVRTAEGVVVVEGDVFDVLPTYADATFHAVVTDPPYGLEFMGAEWDAPWRDGLTKEQGGRVIDDPAALKGFQDRPGAGNAFTRSRIRFGGLTAPNASQALQEWNALWLAECLRVLKPGGFLLAFSGTRTYHRLACAAEDVGFEVRDMIEWFYGSGFPKSKNVSLAIDEHLGRAGDREEVVDGRWAGRYPNGPGGNLGGGGAFDGEGLGRRADGPVTTTRPASAAAAAWEGWGTALKPAHEPILLARKPLAGTVAANVLEHGAGGLNVGGSRIGLSKDVPASPRRAPQGPVYSALNAMTGDEDGFDPNVGRWPANVVLSHSDGCVCLGERRVKVGGMGRGTARGGFSESEGFLGGRISGARSDGYRDPDGTEMVEAWECEPGCPVAQLDAQSGDVGAAAPVRGTEPSEAFSGGVYGRMGRRAGAFPGDAGGASRFFYVAKASRAEREAGLEHLAGRRFGMSSGAQAAIARGEGGYQQEPDETSNGLNRVKEVRNHHPTVKPITLMRHLLRLVVPAGGVALDPFLGSGTTAVAAALEGCGLVGVEREAEYVEIARARLAFWREHGEAALDEMRRREQGARQRQELEAAGQLDLFG